MELRIFVVWCINCAKHSLGNAIDCGLCMSFIKYTWIILDYKSFSKISWEFRTNFMGFWSWLKIKKWHSFSYYSVKVETKYFCWRKSVWANCLVLIWAHSLNQNNIWDLTEKVIYYSFKFYIYFFIYSHNCLKVQSDYVLLPRKTKKLKFIFAELVIFWNR